MSGKNEVEYLEEETQVDELLMNGEPVILRNPGMKAFPEFLKVARDMSKAGPNANTSNMMENFTDEAIIALTNLINMTVEKSFPDMEEELRDEWALANNVILMSKVLEMCSPKQKTRQKSKVDKMLKFQNDRKSIIKE